MKKRSLQFELTGKISIGLIIVTILVSSAIILLETIQYNNIILDSAYKNMSGTVDTIDYYFEDVKTPMVMLARNDSVVKAMEHYSDMTNREKLETNNTLKEFVQNIASFKSFISDIIILGNEGFQYNVYSNDQSKFLKKVDFSALPYFDKVNEERRRLYYIGEHETDYYQADNMRVYSVVLPVYKNQKHIGYIICDIDAAMIDDSLKKNAEGESAKIVVCDELGNLIYEQGNDKISAEHILAAEKKAQGSMGPLEQFFSHGELLIEVKSEKTDWVYLYAIPYENLNRFGKVIFLFDVTVILLGLVAVTFFSGQLTRQILTPLKNIIYMIKDMQINQGAQELAADYQDMKSVSELSIQIEHMIRRMDKLIRENYLYELKRKDLQIQILTHQLSPHFLYNTLQLIDYQSMVNRQENVSKIISRLSYILRYSMSGNKMVALREELEYVRAYLDIYQLRYENKLTCQIEERSRANPQIPKMILEPVVENCIKHGFSQGMNGARIRIVIEEQGENLEISVRDNGRGIPAEHLAWLREHMEEEDISGEHIGLRHGHSILKLCFGNGCGLKINSEEGYFTEVTVRVPTEAHRETGDQNI